MVAASAGYRLYDGAQLGTGNLTLPQPAPNKGESAKIFRATRYEDGGSFELSRDGIYVLAFWSTLNKSTDRAQPELKELAHEYKAKGVSFVVVYVSNVPDGEENAPYTVLQDSSGELTALYNIKRVPRLFLVDNGKIDLVQNGYYWENDEQLREELDQLLSNET